MQKIECQECGFMMQSENEDEMMGMMGMHMMDKHGMMMPEEDMRGMMQSD